MLFPIVTKKNTTLTAIRKASRVFHLSEKNS
jgi:hypothetical protein